MKKIVFTLIATALFFSKVAIAAEWYVDNTANGANIGATWTNAWQSFADIVWGGAGVVAGDTLYISGGTDGLIYYETLNPKISGQPGLPITIRPGQDAGHNGLVTVTNAAGSGVSLPEWITLNGKYGATRNITVTGNGAHGVTLGSNSKIIYTNITYNGNAPNEYGIYIRQNASGWEIAYNYLAKNYHAQMGQTVSSSIDYGQNSIHHNSIISISGDGIKGGAQNTNIYNNTIGGVWSSGEPGAHIDGIQPASYPEQYVKIYNNHFYGLPSYTIYIEQPFQSGLTMQYVQIYNNIFEGIGNANEAAIVLGFNYGKTGTWDNILIANNTIKGYDYPGISIGATGGVGNCNFGNNVIVKNNIITNTAWSHNNAITIACLNEKNVDFDYNLVYAGTNGKTSVAFGANNYVSFGETSWAIDHPNLSHNINTNPQLDANYRPTGITGPVDRGTTINSIFTTDMDRVPRPQGPAWDIGAYEYTGIRPSTPGNWGFK